MGRQQGGNKETIRQKAKERSIKGKKTKTKKNVREGEGDEKKKKLSL